MKSKKLIAIIITLVLLMLPMIVTNVQAASTSAVTDLQASKNGNTVILRWEELSNVDGYDVYVSVSNKPYEYIGSTSQNAVGLIGFKENYTYSAKVCSYTLNSNGSKSQGYFSDSVVINTTAEKTLAQTRNLTACQNGGNVTLNWSEVNYAEGYQVFVKLPNFGYVNAGSVSTNSVIVQGLVNGEKYEFKVRAYETSNQNTLTYGEFSNTQTLKINNKQYDSVKEEILPPKAVENLNVSDITEKSAYITWNKVSDAAGYEVWVSENYGNYELIKSTTNRYVRLSNLSQDTYYKVKVISYKKGNDGERIYGNVSDIARFYTERKEIGEIEDLDIDYNETKAYLSWSKATNANGYNVYVSKNSNDYYLETSTTSRSYTLRNLSYDTTYRVKIVPYVKENGEKREANFAIVKAFTTDPEKITIGNLKKVNITVKENTANLSWSKVNNADLYYIYLAKGYNNNYYLQDIVSSTSYKLTNLSYDTFYSVKVIPCKWVNDSLYEGGYAVKTLITSKYKEELGKSENVFVEVKNRNEAHTSWWEVKGADGYSIYLAKNNGSYQKLKDLKENYYVIYSDKLNYNTNYTFKVVAYRYVNGKKEYSTEAAYKTFKTERESAYEANDGVQRVQGVEVSVENGRATITWDDVKGALYYEVEYFVPGVEYFNYTVYGNSKTILNNASMDYPYTVRVRAYKYVNGRLASGPYSYIKEFMVK